jgi:hypothetical protein
MNTTESGIHRPPAYPTHSWYVAATTGGRATRVQLRPAAGTDLGPIVGCVLGCPMQRVRASCRCRLTVVALAVARTRAR